MSHGRKVWRRLGRSLRVRLGALVLSLMLLPAVFAELVAADQPLVAKGEAGWVVLPALFPSDAARDHEAAAIGERYRDVPAVWPLVRFGPDTVSAAGPSAAPSWSHPLGTDAHGRDLVARLVYGARTALGLALSVLAAALILGVAFGAMAGYLGGFWDEMLSRPVELIETFPAIVVVAVLRAIDSSGSVWSLAAAVLLVRWAEVARLVRGEVIRLASEEHVLAARALGCSHTRILRRHILPIALRPVVVSSLFGAASVVLLEVAAAFLGIGLEGSWGALLADGLTTGGGTAGAVWATLAIAATVGAVYLLADAVGENLDARVAPRHAKARPES